MLVADDIENRLFGALANLDRRSFLLGGASSAAVLQGANAQLMMLGVGSGSQSAPSGAAPVAVSGLAPTPSINFTDANEGIANYSSGVQFPNLAVNAPASNAMNPWYLGFSFTVPVAMTAGVLNMVASRGSNGYSGSYAYFYFQPNGRFVMQFTYAGLASFPINSAVTLNPGESYTLVHGIAAPTAGTPGFFYVAIIDRFGNAVFNQSGNSYNNYFGANTQVLTGLGGAIGVASGQASYGFAGSVSNAFMGWGTLPTTAGLAATASSAFTTSSPTISVAAIPAGIAAGQIVLDTTSGHPLGAISSWNTSALTITLSANAYYASTGAADALLIGQTVLTSGGAAYNAGTLDLGSLGRGQISGKDLAIGLQANGGYGTHALRYFCPLAGPGGWPATNTAAVSTGSAIRIGTAATTTAAVSTTANAVTASVLSLPGATIQTSTLPAGIGPRMNVYDQTTNAQVGTVASWSGSASPYTITLFEPNVINPVGSGDTLLFGAIPATIRAGQYVFDTTTKLPAGTVASFDRTKNLITISQANPLNALAASDILLIGGNTRASAAYSTSGGQVLSVAMVPTNISVGQNLMNLTSSAKQAVIGTVASWDMTANTITISQANPAVAIASGDTISVSGLNADALSVATTNPMTLPLNWTPAYLPIAGDPCTAAPWLSVRSEGESYVWGVSGTPTPGTTAPVWFRGHYATSNGVVPAFEAKLFRKDTRATFVDWTALSGVTTSPAAGSTVSFAGGYTTPVQSTVATAITTVGATTNLRLYGSSFPPGLANGATIYAYSVANKTWAILGTLSYLSTAPTLIMTTTNLVTVAVGDIVNFGGTATFVFATPLPCGVPVGTTVNVAGLSTTPVGGVNVTAVNGALPVLNSTPNSITVFYPGNIQTLAGLQNLGSGTFSWSGFGLYSGFVTASQGVGFTRSLRYAGQAATAVNTVEKHAVGIVTFFQAQSHLASMSGAASVTGTIASSGTSLQIAPIDGDNVFCSALLPRTGAINDTTTNTANGDAWSAQALHAGRQWNSAALGDGLLVFANKMQALTNLPIMIISLSLSGHTPGAWWQDRQQVQTGPSYPPLTWTPAPNGTATALTLSLQANSVLTAPHFGKPNLFGTHYVGPETAFSTAYTGGVGGAPMIPGTLAGTINGITVSDDGAGNIVASGITGTIDYHGTSSTSGYPTLTMTFAVAPAVGVNYSLSWTTSLEYIASDASTIHPFADFFGSVGVPPGVTNGASTPGTPAVPHTGTVGDAYAALGNNVLTAIIHPWWSPFITLANQYTGGSPALTYGFFASGAEQMDAMRYLHQQWPAARNAKRFWAAPSRGDLGGNYSVTGGAAYGGAAFQIYQYVANQIALGLTDIDLLPDTPNCSCANAGTPGTPNAGQHQDFAGTLLNGEHFAVQVASSLGFGGAYRYGASGPTAGIASAASQVSSAYNSLGNGTAAAPVLGPVLKAVTRTLSGSNVAALVLNYDLPNGSSLATLAGGGIGSQVQGFTVGTGTTDVLAFAARTTNGSDTNFVNGTSVAAPFTAAITASNQVTITFATPSNWPNANHISLNYNADRSYFTISTFAGYVNDASVGLNALLGDNSGGYVYPTPAMVAAFFCPVAPAGNPATSVLCWVA